jgi:hypothetical protein
VRNSGSRVRFPVTQQILMFVAAIRAFLLCLVDVDVRIQSGVH